MKTLLFIVTCFAISLIASAQTSVEPIKSIKPNLTSTVDPKMQLFMAKREMLGKSRGSNNEVSETLRKGNVSRLKAKKSSSKLLYTEYSYEFETVSDSTNESKFTYTYDSRGNCVLTILYKWNEIESAWEYYLKYEYAFDDNNNIISDIDFIWDSDKNIWEGDRKYIHAFDSRGYCILGCYYKWDSKTTNWVEDSKEQKTFDNNGNRTSHSSYKWDVITNNWVGYFKYEDSYDSNNQCILYLGYNWDTTAQVFVVKSKWEYSHDEHKNLTSSNCYLWDSDNSIWNVYSKNKYEYTYNDTLKIDEYQYSMNLIDNVWTNITKANYEYDDNNRETLQRSYYWNDTTDSWSDQLKYVYVYDAKGNLTLKSCKIMNSTYAIPFGSFKVQYSYDSKNNLILELDSSSLSYNKQEFSYDTLGNQILNTSYEWDGSSNLWNGQSKREFIFDALGNEIQYDSYRWDIYNRIWYGLVRDKFVYDSNNNLVIDRQYGGTYNNELSYVTYYTWVSPAILSVSPGILLLGALVDTSATFNINSNTNWTISCDQSWATISTASGSGNATVNVTVGHSDYTRSATITVSTDNETSQAVCLTQQTNTATGVALVVNKKIEVYPNPASNELNIKNISKNAKLSIYNLGNQLVFEKNYAGQAIEINQLTSGIYILRITEGKQISVTKFVKQ